ncbi:hypothetical protein HEK131_39770 [Streptomyces seoulensis]|nr:hypothetical protein HEK131_39770 [Streptomyces seoulensis]
MATRSYELSSPVPASGLHDTERVAVVADGSLRPEYQFPVPARKDLGPRQVHENLFADRHSLLPWHLRERIRL